MAYATIEDLEGRWRELTPDEQATASVLLSDAAVYLDTQVIVDPEDEHQADVLRMVSCAMVRRAMVSSASDSYGVTQQTISADIYSQTQAFANPTGDLYLTKAEKSMLGIGNKGYVLGVRPVIGWDAE